MNPLQISIGISIVIVLIPFFNYIMNSAYDFLYINKPLPHADVLVIEGWVYNRKRMQSYINEAISLGNYKHVIVPGRKNSISLPWGLDAIDSSSEHPLDINQSPPIDTLITHSLQLPDTRWHRTFSSAFVVKSWIHENLSDIKKINVCSASIHARKTWWAYRRVFKSTVEVGIVALPPRRLLKKKQLFHRRGGIKGILYYFTGYLYARLFPLPLLPGK